MKKEERNTLRVTSLEVTRCHTFKDGNVSFDMKLNGIQLYGLSLVWYKKEKRYFIGFPSKKSGNKYYNHFWFPVDDDLLQEIQSDIERMLAE